MPTTSNFGWTTPADTDLVKDGAAAIRTLGNGIDTSLIDLKGGTTGQILAKASNTDLDFSWIANDQGDITEVTAGTGISGGGTSGAVTITNSMATAIDAKGDLIVGTGSDTFSRLAVGGTNGHTLQVDSSTSTGLKWAAAGTGDLVRITTNTFSAQTAVNLDNCFSATYDNYLVLAYATQSASNAINLRLRTSTTNYDTNDQKYGVIYNSYDNLATGAGGTTNTHLFTASSGTGRLAMVAFIFNPFAAIRTQAAGYRIDENLWANFGYTAGNSNSYESLNFSVSGGNFTGEISVYGFKRS